MQHLQAVTTLRRTALIITSLPAILVGCADHTPEARPKAAPERLECDLDSYDPAELDADLANYEQLAQESGVVNVRSCGDAENVRVAYDHLASTEADFFAPEQDYEADVPELQSTEPEPAADRKIFAGVNSDQRQVVRTLIAGVRCSAVMINRDHLLTANHCVPSSVSTGKNGTVMSVTLRWETRNGNEAVGVYPTSILWRKSGYGGTGDAADDLAMVRLRGGTLPDTPTMRIWRSSMDRDDTSHFFWSHGWGATSNSGGAGDLRTTSSFSEVSRVHDNWFHASPSGTRVCRGDDGGPAVHWNRGVPFVLGLMSNVDMPSTSLCPSPGARTEWTRLRYRRGWIEDRLGFKCNLFSTADGDKYLRCW